MTDQGANPVPSARVRGGWKVARGGKWWSQNEPPDGHRPQQGDDHPAVGVQKKSCRCLLRRRPVTEVVIRQDTHILPPFCLLASRVSKKTRAGPVTSPTV